MWAKRILLQLGKGTTKCSGWLKMTTVPFWQSLSQTQPQSHKMNDETISAQTWSSLQECLAACCPSGPQDLNSHSCRISLKRKEAAASTFMLALLSWPSWQPIPSCLLRTMNGARWKLRALQINSNLKLKSVKKEGYGQLIWNGQWNSFLQTEARGPAK